LVKAGFERTVGVWLLGVSGFLISMIALGGYTRLSGSGLSMTDWRIEGRPLPRTEESWIAEFENYKLYPEYQRLHNGTMDLDEFKRIYFVEWFHRMWGRTAGVLFGAPLLYFAARGVLKPRFAVGLGGLLALGFSQAFVGWWMVRSGLDAPEQHTPFAGENQAPRVSPYRLASHFSAGMTLYVGCLWGTLSLLRKSPLDMHPTMEAVKAARRLRALALPVCSIVALTILSGPFVAGNDAGLAYNTWPKMLDDWVPPEWIAAATEPTKSWRMFFEDTACVQFDHRMLAYTSTIGTLGLALRAVTMPGASVAVTNVARFLPVVVSLQAALGITTLLWYVPIELGVLHQAGGIAVLTTVMILLHTLRVPTIAAAATTTASAAATAMHTIRPGVAAAAAAAPAAAAAAPAL
jgi:cytochrome c oxidase assembly protein subunit 15